MKFEAGYASRRRDNDDDDKESLEGKSVRYHGRVGSQTHRWDQTAGLGDEWECRILTCYGRTETTTTDIELCGTRQVR